MKTLPTILLAVLLCGSAFASTFQETKQAAIAALQKPKVTVTTTRKAADGLYADRHKLTLLDFIAVLGNEADAKNASAWKSQENLGTLATALRTLRVDVAALPSTAETKTFIGRDLDPALAALDVVQKNPAGRTKAHAEALARLAAVMAPAK